jgi:YcxB-like protein
VTTEAEGHSPDSVTITYDLTVDEVVPILRSQLIKASNIRKVMLLVLAIVALGAGLIALSGAQAIVGWIAVGFATLVSLMYASLCYIAPGRLWKRMAANRGPKTLDFSDDGVHVHTRDSDSVIRWPAYSESIEKEAVYLLRRDKRGAYTIVPKRAFRSSSEEWTFRSIAERHTTTYFQAHSSVGEAS